MFLIIKTVNLKQNKIKKFQCSISHFFSPIPHFRFCWYPLNLFHSSGVLFAFLWNETKWRSMKTPPPPPPPPPPHIKEEKKDHVYMQHNKPTLALSPFLPLLTSDQKWFRKETLQTAHEDKKEPCMSRLAFISWDIWTDIWFICSIFSTLFLTLIDFVHPTSTITLWSACEKTIKTKKDINAICGFIMPLKKKT